MPVATRAMLRNKQEIVSTDNDSKLSLIHPDFMTPPPTPSNLVRCSPPPAPRKRRYVGKKHPSIVKMHREETCAKKLICKMRRSYSKFVNKLIEIENDIKHHDMRMFYTMFPRNELDDIHEKMETFNADINDFVNITADDLYQEDYDDIYSDEDLF